MVQEYDLPIDGEVELSSGRKIQVRLRHSPQKKLILEVLEKDVPEFYEKELKGSFSGFCKNSYNIIFFNCRKLKGINSINIKSDSYISCQCLTENTSNFFINKNSLRKELSFRILNFDKWLYPTFKNDKKSEVRFLDKNRNKANKENKAKYVEILISDKTNSYGFNYKDYNFKLHIIDTFSGNQLKPSQINLYQNCTLKIECDKEISVDFFIKIIKSISSLFSLLFNQTAKIKSITEKTSDYFISYKLINDEYEENENLSGLFNIFYEDIKEDIGNVIQLWFDICDEYEFIIDSICQFEEIKTLSSSISEYAQLLETYGNILNKGACTRNDIKKAVLEIKAENFTKIFHTDSDEKDYYTIYFDVRKLSSDITEQKKLVGEQISNLRNHAVHPYKNGRLKTPQDSNIHKTLMINNDINIEATNILVICTFKILKVLLFQKLNIDKFYTNY